MPDLPARSRPHDARTGGACAVRPAARLFAALGLVGLLAGCQALPGDGPLAQDLIEQPPDGPAREFVSVRIDNRVVNIAGQYRPAPMSTYFGLAGPRPELLIDQGDQLTINIWEAGADGLFSSTASKATAIKSVVDSSGRIFVPYVGPMTAAGRSVEAVRTSIENALEDRAIQPQVQVVVDESVVNSATVMGDVGSPGLYPIAIPGTRILDLVALAGGSRFPTYETQIMLKRGGRVAYANLEDIFDNPPENVPVRPGDDILVSHAPRTFTVFGATGSREEFKFETRRLTLAEALARAGGLSDNRANAMAVFLFRFEPQEIARQLSERAETVPAGSRVFVPVVYRLNLRDPEGFFLAQLFDMRDEDLIYVANHPTADLGKFLQIISPLLGNVTQVSNFAE